MWMVRASMRISPGRSRTASPPGTGSVASPVIGSDTTVRATVTRPGCGATGTPPNWIQLGLRDTIGRATAGTPVRVNPVGVRLTVIAPTAEPSARAERARSAGLRLVVTGPGVEVNGRAVSVTEPGIRLTVIRLGVGGRT
jgi:hypothetical protein